MESVLNLTAWRRRKSRHRIGLVLYVYIGEEDYEDCAEILIGKKTYLIFESEISNIK